jgi:hypothetical protein
MATTPLYTPTTKSQPLTTAFLGSDFEIRGASTVEVVSDDETIGLVVRWQYVGGDQLTYTVNAVASGSDATVWYLAGDGAKGSTLYLNVKSATGTPTALITVR